ncbi:UDP-N-acetylmuramoyl-tripeptide--D-alanyl-D-alanine ligase [Thermotoga profunda]|uniref:UDP-N-acetylmuramoyl-tripeptide--D-alanyl-D- alanine ligase n=1 Tax=Thermotoga profunda TaxID=1508420 RepID=UPI0006937AC2|nr:UDP-N-acetylmuramoyl-tripeptide--D-alanyl-D-alanine ligase [Thermotoga profunda]
MYDEFCFVIDSRKVIPGCIFVAIKGEKTDGHLYVKDALSKGAKYAVVEKPVDAPKECLIRVDSTVDFLINTAWERIQRYEPFVIGITGSNGKTTTKELIYQSIGKELCFSNPGNFNTEIGLPLSIINHYRGERYLALEMAMNKFGDIARLCQIAQPDISVLLNVGTAHRGVAGSDQAILDGKLQIVEMMKPNGTAVVINDERILQRISTKSLVTFGYQKGDYQLMNYFYDDLCTIAAYKTINEIVQFQFRSIWNVGQLTNIAAVLAVLDLIKIKPSKDLIENFSPIQGRFKVFRHRDVFIIDDCYNASLESFKVAVETLRKLGKRSFAVVGSIKEQGIYSDQTHQELGKILECTDGVIVYNSEPEIDAMVCSKEILRTNDIEKIVSFLRKTIKPQDAILFKASRAVQMENVLAKYLEGDQ